MGFYYYEDFLNKWSSPEQERKAMSYDPNTLRQLRDVARNAVLAAEKKYNTAKDAAVEQAVKAATLKATNEFAASYAGRLLITALDNAKRSQTEVIRFTTDLEKGNTYTYTIKYDANGTPPKVEPKPDHRPFGWREKGYAYQIPSRSGGPYHEVVASRDESFTWDLKGDAENFNWSCNCEAGSRGVKCWALDVAKRDFTSPRPSYRVNFPGVDFGKRRD